MLHSTWSTRPWFPQVAFASEDQFQSEAVQRVVHSTSISAAADARCIHSTSAAYDPTSDQPTHCRPDNITRTMTMHVSLKPIKTMYI